MSVKYLDNAGTQYLVNKIKAIDGKIPTESQITTMITTALNTYKEGIVTIVESLPQTGEEGKLYLLVDPSDSDVYIIYTWEENAFKRMGSKTFTLTVDSALSSTSTNPVQNKVVKSALDGKANSSHSHGSITNDGKLGTASRVVITGTDKKIGISSVTTTELGYLSGVTSAIQTQLDGKSATGHTHTAGDVAGLASVATSGSYNDLSNKPTINDSTITIQKNGSTVDSFTTNGSNKTINITVPTKTSDLTNDSGFLTSTDISSKANDSEVLHKAQTETVTGEKTFKKDIKIIDLNANERPGVKFEVNGTFRTFEDAKDALPDTDFGVGTVWSAFWLDDNTKIQNSMSDYVINDITFGTTNYGSVIELNNYYKVKYEEADNIQTDLRGMLRFELAPYAGVQKDSMIWTEPKLYFYAKLDNDEFGETILGHEYAHWSKAYINEINCYEIKFGGNSIHDILEHIVSLSYVTHYSSTALTSNSTNSLSIIDNQDSVKVDDKVIDSSGKMFYITSVDLRNNEFEVGSVVDTFAKDSAVSTAQATANSAQQTATTARQQSYVFRYSGTAITDNSTIAYSTIDNTDNIKSGDKILDVDGKMFEITAVDTTNQTVTVGTALIDLALDANVVHTSGDETVGGIKSFSDDTYITSLNFTDEVPSQSSSSSSTMPIITTITYGDSSPSVQARLNLRVTADGIKSLYPHENNQYALGLTSRKWSEVHGVTYYYGSSDTEFSDKFVTTDTSQTITGAKTWANSQVWSVNCQRRITSSIEKGQVPSSSQARNDYYTLKNGSTTYGDALGVFGCVLSDSNVVSTYFHAIKNVAGSSVRTTFSVKYYTNTNEKTVETNGDIIPTDSRQNLGNSTSKWSTINGLNPSSLSMPDLSNGIDISSYLTNAGTTTPSEYTPSVNGYICVQISADSPPFIRMYNDYGFDKSVYTERNENGSTSGGTYSRFASLIFPANKDVKVYIIIMPSTFGIISAKFFPCQGNV